MSESSLIDEIAELGIDEESWPVLALLPLVEVAWADGEVHGDERAKVLEIATRRFNLTAKAHAHLDHWLATRPTAGLLLRSRVVLVTLAERARGLRGDTEGPLPAVMDLAVDVAMSAGGLFGFGSVSRTEREALHEIAAALKVDPKRLWEEEDDIEDAPTDVGGMFVPPRPAAPVEVDDSGPAAVGKGVLARNDLLFRAEVPEAGEVSVGRGRGNVLQVLDDGEVSRNHCRIFEKNGHYFIEDKGSLNGTRVSGEPVTVMRLFGGERLTIGLAEWSFTLEA